MINAGRKILLLVVNVSKKRVKDYLSKLLKEAQESVLYLWRGSVEFFYILSEVINVNKSNL